MSIFATAEQVHVLKGRSQRWEECGFPQADELIPGVVSLMNDFEGVACVFSCEGHYRPEEKGIKRQSDFYLMMAVTEEGFKIISKIFGEVQNRLMISSRETRIRLNAFIKEHGNTGFIDPVPSSNVTEFRMSFTSRTWPVGSINAEEFYKVVIITGQTNRPEKKAQFFANFMHVLKEVHAEQQQ